MPIDNECESVFSGADKHYSKDFVHKLLENNAVPCIWITNHINHIEPSYIRRFKIVLEVKKPDRAMLTQMARKAFKGLGVSSRYIDDMVKRDCLTPANIGNAAHVAKVSGFKKAFAEDAISKVLEQNYSAIGLSPVKQNYVPDIQQDMAYVNVVNPISELDMIEHGVSERISVRVLLEGPPGTGKTAYVHALAAKYGINLIRVTCSDVLDKYVGGSEQNIANIFNKANASGSMILLDEIDSLLTARESLNAIHDIQLVNEVLNQLEAFQLPLFAATNFADQLDRAVSRRFDFKITFDYLNKEQVIGLFRKVAGSSELDKNAMKRLGKLTHLTPGDFAIMARPFKLMQAQSSCQQISILEAENNAKCASKSVGFISSVA